MLLVRFRHFVYSISRRCAALCGGTRTPCRWKSQHTSLYISKLFQRRGSIYTRPQDSTYKNHDNPTKSCCEAAKKLSALGGIVTSWLPASTSFYWCLQEDGGSSRSRSRADRARATGQGIMMMSSLSPVPSFFAAPVPCLMSPPAPAATDRQSRKEDAKPQTHGKPLPMSSSSSRMPCHPRCAEPREQCFGSCVYRGDGNCLSRCRRSGLLHSKSTRALLILRHLYIYPQPD
jgi:hypothetical protein